MQQQLVLVPQQQRLLQVTVQCYPMSESCEEHAVLEHVCLDPLHGNCDEEFLLSDRFQGLDPGHHLGLREMKKMQQADQWEREQQSWKGTNPLLHYIHLPTNHLDWFATL